MGACTSTNSSKYSNKAFKEPTLQAVICSS